MATVVLGTLGNIVYPGVGGVIGGLLGAGLDALLARALAPDVPRRQPTPGDTRRLPGADEGAGIPWVQGSATRVPGQVIWLHERKPAKVDGTRKGKVEGTTVDNYYVDVAIGVCRNVTSIDSIRRIWAAGELIYLNQDTPVTIDTGAHNIIVLPVLRYYTRTNTGMWDMGNCTDLGDGNVERLEGYLLEYRFELPVGSAEAATVFFFKPGLDITITGATDPLLNGTYKLINIHSRGIDGVIVKWVATVERCRYEFDDVADFCTPLNSCPTLPSESGSGITLSQIIPGGSSPYFESITQYNGNPLDGVNGNANPDPFMESIEGVGQVSAHRGLTYCVIQNMDVTKWAGTVPQFEVEVEQEPSTLVGQAIRRIIRRADVFAFSQIDVSDLDGWETIPGYISIGPRSPAEQVAELMTLYGVVAQQQVVYDGDTPRIVLQFLRRDSPLLPEIVIPYSETSAREGGTEGSPHVSITRGSRADVPREFVLEFQNADKSHLPGTSSYGLDTAQPRNTQKLSVPVALTADDADRLARGLLWRSIYHHDEFEARLMPSEFAVMPGDRVRFTETTVSDIRGRVSEATIGENGIVLLRGRIDDDLLDNQIAGGNAPVPDNPVVDPTPFVEVYQLDIAPLNSSDATKFGIYLYALSGGTGTFPSTDVYVSQNGLDWTFLQTIPASAIGGNTQTALAPASEYFWDTDSTVEVVLSSDATLMDATEEQVASGVNRAWVGGEVIGFTTATLLEPRVYELSGLLRGLNDTRIATDDHDTVEPFVLLPPTGPNVFFTEIPETLYKTLIYIRGVPLGTTLADAEDFERVAFPSAATLRPYRVHGLRATRAGTEDVCVYVSDRTRVPYRIFSELIAPQVEIGDAEDYVAEVYWDSDGATPGRTWELLRELEGCRVDGGEISFGYTRAMQITDLHTSGKIVDGSFPDVYRFWIYRRSDTIGDGRGREFCVKGYGFIEGSDCTD